MVANLQMVGFDADDTLWHNERIFQGTQARFSALLADHAAPEDLQARLLAAERRNLGRYGFGVKGFVLSMIETALEVTDDHVSGRVIRELIETGQHMLEHPVELLPHARVAVEALAGQYRIVLITKGDLIDQERKLAASGLGELFDAVEIVSHKDAATYHGILRRHAIAPGQMVMVGNSMASDILPVLEIGGRAVHVPHHLTWEMEQACAPQNSPFFHALPDLSGLSACLADME